jgi:hypothetical protein
MLTSIRKFLPILAITLLAVPAAAQDFVGHRAFYTVSTLEHGKSGDGTPIGTYAYELRLTCDGYTASARMRLELEGGRTTIISEQQSQMDESRADCAMPRSAACSHELRRAIVSRQDAGAGSPRVMTQVA